MRSYVSEMAPLAQETYPPTLFPHPSPITPPRAFPVDPPCCSVCPKIAHLRAVLELAWAHVGPRWLKITLKHTFEHPKWPGHNFGKVIVDHFWTRKCHLNPTLARAQRALHHSNGVVKSVDYTESLINHYSSLFISTWCSTQSMGSSSTLPLDPRYASSVLKLPISTFLVKVHGLIWAKYGSK